MKKRIIEMVRDWKEWNDWKALMIATDLGTDVRFVRICYLMVH